jgi:general secretion pathway protein G
MKRGFTMIELIFVIVILGILAAVAIPKLTATRDDANIAKGLTEVQMAISDFGAYYTAQGEFADQVKKMTNVANFDNIAADASKNGTIINYLTATGSSNHKCISMQFETNGIVAIGAPDDGNKSIVCQEMRKDKNLAAIISAGNITFGGTGIKRN